MSVIQQIYCTHCTHGSSALERREGDLAHRMLGYSARAGSLEAQELRKCYRQLERYAYYYLPRDTPGEEKLRLIAASAPRRLIFLPSTSGLQVAGQVCYRQTDTEGRPGSYFAHVLFQDEQDGPGRWSPVDCLKLWNARGWVEEDSTSIPFVLRSLYSLSEMHQGARPAIDDAVLWSFLTTPAGGNFDDPAGVIPPRYRTAPPKQRISLLTDVFRGLLEIDFSQRESLVIVVEPSLAALLFYGVARLLPTGPLQGGISFSTYEPNPDRLATTLAATIFHDPLRTDLRPDAYRSRGFAINTFLDRRTDFRRPQAAYVVTALQRLLGEGWDAVDRMLLNLEAVGAKTADDLDILASVDRIVPALFDPRQPLPSEAWRGSPMAIRYLRRVLGRRLAELADPRALESLVGRPQHLLVLELIAAGPDATSTRTAAEYLLRQLPGERIGDLLRLEEISPEDKTDVLVRYVTAQGTLPPGCDQLWQVDAAAGLSNNVAGATAGLSSSVDGSVGQANPGVAAGANPGTAAVGPAATNPRPATVGPGDANPANVVVSPGGHAGPEDANRGDDLLCRLLDRLDLKTLVKFYGDVAAKHSDVFVLALLASYRQKKTDPKPLAEILGAMSEDSLVSLYRSQGAGFIQDYPANEPVLGRRLHELIQSLPKHLGQFRDRLDLVTAGKHLLPEDDDLTTATAWSSCRAAILEIGRLQEQRGGMFRQPPMDQIETAARRMSEAIVRALPRDRFEDDRSGSAKRKCLERVGSHLLKGKPLLPRDRWQFAAIWQKVAWHCEQGVWPSTPLWKLRPKSKLPVPPLLLLAIVVVLVLLGVALVVLNRRGGPQETTTISGKVDATADSSEERLQRQAARQKEMARKAEEDRQREAAEAAQEESQRQEREAEAKRRAAAEEAKSLATGATVDSPDRSRTAGQASSGTHAEQGEPPVKLTPEAEPSPPPRAAAEDWKSKAERFAHEHLGRFIDGEPLNDGRAEIPLDVLPAAPPATTWFLGNGRIYLDNGTYPFGDGFERELPEVRYEIPKLAADLHLKSAFVELHKGDQVLRLVVGGVPADPLGGSEADNKARMADLNRRINMLIAKLRTYRGVNTADEPRDEAFRAIIELAQIKFPPVPPRPDPGDPRYHAPPDRPDVFNSERYNADVNAYKDALAQNDAVRAAVPEIGTRKLREYQQALESLQRGPRQSESQARRENDPALAALKQRCQRISALIYQPVLRHGESAPAGDGPSAPAGQPAAKSQLQLDPATTPETQAAGANSAAVNDAGTKDDRGGPNRGHALAGQPPSIDGAFRIEKRPITGLRAPVMAKVRFVVNAEGGKKLPPVLRKSAVIGSLLIEQNKEGVIRLIETPEIEVPEMGVPMTNLIHQDTVSLRPQIRFFRRPADRFQSKLECVAVSNGAAIEPVESDSEYIVRFEISDVGLGKLLRLLDGQ